MKFFGLLTERLRSKEDLQSPNGIHDFLLLSLACDIFNHPRETL